MERSKVKVRIMGKEYCLTFDEEREYVLNVVQKVNEKMNEISSKSKINPFDIAVLTSLNICDELTKQQINKDSLNDEIEYLKSQIILLRNENKVLTAENNFLKDEILMLRK